MIADGSNVQLVEYYQLVARHSQKCLDVSGAGMQNGARLHQWPSWGGANQQWQLVPVSGQMVVRTPDGTQHTFAAAANGEYRCTQIKDRNGNYLTIEYDGLGHPISVVDTLDRTINFDYDGNGNLAAIKQLWNGAEHVWAAFTYESVYLQGNFPGLSVNGPNNSDITVLKQVWVHDGTRHEFDYTSWGQVTRITKYAADNHPLSSTSYNLPADSGGGQSDCPRFSERRDWAENWNSWLGGAEIVTSYSVAGDGSWSQVTLPDGTVHKEFFAMSGWQRGLTTLSEVWAGGVRQKWTTTAWTQDDPNAPYPLNPRPEEINIYDAEGNRKRTTISYTAYGLPGDIREYGADGGSVWRRTHLDYRFDGVYLERRIIGLPGVRSLYEGESALVAKSEFHYDWGGEWFSAQAPSVQHDGGNYGAGFLYGRGNLVGMRRYNIDAPDDANQAVWQQLSGYNAAGLPIFSRDANWHTTNISYADSYSDGNNNRNTLAYPTTVTDADGYTSTAQYHYDLGAVTRTQGPPPAGQVQGGIQTMEYDGVGRLERVTTVNSGAYTKWVYPAGQNHLVSYAKREAETGEVLASLTWYDGFGRVRHNLTPLPNSAGGYSTDWVIYDAMGRVKQQAKPTEINGNWQPVGDDTAGWMWTQQAYDWQGRPTLTTMPDGATTELSYGGCGCAGGEVTTTRDERGRRKRYRKDVLGRLKQVEELNWDTSVYATTNYQHNGRDQVEDSVQVGQWRHWRYDGHGRLQQRYTPEQGWVGYGYNADDTVQSMGDARGATTNFVYNHRHLVTNLTYGVPAGVAATPNVSFGYDAAGNRTQMTDGLGSVSYGYDQMSRLTAETRTFSGVGVYTLSYEYNLAGQLTRVTNPWGAQVAYGHDAAGRVASVEGGNYAGVGTYATNLGYTAFGALRGMTYGNSRGTGTGVRTLGLSYDSRLRLTEWHASYVMGWSYRYQYFNEHSNRVTYAQSSTDATLDRSYDYDQVGRLQYAHTGVEARRHITGVYEQAGEVGPYSQHTSYDVWGNTTRRLGWGGIYGSYTDWTLSYTNNRRADLGYDAAGNLTFDGGQYTYDATGQQTFATYPPEWGGYTLQQSYDGDGLRVKKVDGGVTLSYLRSSVLGNQVVAEIGQEGGWYRGYVYLGGQLLALQQNGTNWVHQDPVTKSQRLTDVNGQITATIDLDAWGGETEKSWNQGQQPQRYTSYLRDGNGSDDAMMRRYNRWWSRFDQPDPSDGSLNLADPQSFNRYSYTQNDPVNNIDPDGLNMCPAQFGSCGGGGDSGSGFRGNWADDGGFFGGGGFGGMSAAEAAYVQRLQNTYDAIAANRALQRGDFATLAALMAANSTLQFQDPRTGDTQVDWLARYLYAEANNNYDEMLAIGQVFILRWYVGFDGVTTLNQALSRGSIADDGRRGSPDWRVTANVRSMGVLELDKFRTAIRAAQFVYYENPNYAASGGGILPGNDYLWFVSNASTPSNFIRGTTSFFNFDPQRPSTKGVDILTAVGMSP